MQFSTRKRFRLVTGALLLLLLVSTPLAFGLWRPVHGVPTHLPGFLGIYEHGLTSLGVAGIVAGALGSAFAFWLIVGERKAVGRRILNQRARNRVNGVQAARALGVILGGAGLIVGSLSGMYAALVEWRPDLVEYPRLPLTFELAVPCLVLGGLAYAAGRFGR
jgi:hypothetical protein